MAAACFLSVAEPWWTSPTHCSSRHSYSIGRSSRSVRPRKNRFGSPASTSDAPSGVAPWPSTALSAMGYYVSRSPRGDHLAIDAGHHGFLNGGHAHADALALTLSVRGLPLLIDPGTGCYTVNPVVRDRFRSTRYHNTVTVDGRSQSIPNGPFHWHSVGHARLHQWHSTNDGDFFEGAHDAYAPVVHNRAIISQPGCWCVVDSLLGPGTHLAEAHWHVDPSWQAQRIGGGMVRIDVRTERSCGS